MSLDTEISLTAHGTAVSLLIEHTQRTPQRVSIRQKRLGVWRTFTWAECQEEVSKYCHALVSLRVRPGDVVGILGTNRAESLFVQLATQACGGMVLWLAADTPAQQASALLERARCHTVFVDDQRQVDKIAGALGRQPLQHIVCYDPRGVAQSALPGLRLCSDLLEEASLLQEAAPSLLSDLGTRSDPAAGWLMCATSGIASSPKLVVLGQRSTLEHARAVLRRTVGALGTEYVPVMSLGHASEQVFATAHWLLGGCVLNFPESESTVLSDMREIGPHALLLPAESWDALVALVQSRLRESSQFARRALNWGHSLRAASGRAASRSVLADLLGGSAARDRLGLSRLRFAGSIGGPVSPSTQAFCESIGVQVRQLYGITESAGVCAIQTSDGPRGCQFEPISTRFRVSQSRVDSNGGLQIQWPSMLLGYFDDPLPTDSTWLSTGDAGRLLATGLIEVGGRHEDLAASLPMPFAARDVEYQLRSSPFVEQAIVIADPKGSLTAMLHPRMSALVSWANDRRVPFRSPAQLLQHADVSSLFASELASVNATLQGPLRIARALLLDAPLGKETGDLSWTGKLRRGEVARRYRGALEAAAAGAMTVKPFSNSVDSTSGAERRWVVVHLLHGVPMNRPALVMEA